MRDGLVVIDKDPGWTSHDVVAKLRSVFGQKRVGHAGTLDPDATGVLLVGLGRATRLLRFLQAAPKTYRGTIQFGIATNTLDAAGTTTQETPMTFARHELEAALLKFVGDIKQIPPMVSAVKVDGRRLHELARAGEEIERAPRPVTIYRFVLEDFDDTKIGFPTATVLVECSTGTYIRTLAADLGEALGGCAHIATLRRLSSGSFVVDEAHGLDAVAANPDECVLTARVAMRDLAQITVDADTKKLVAHGRPIIVEPTVDNRDGSYAIVGPEGSLLAVYDASGNKLVANVVIATEVED